MSNIVPFPIGKVILAKATRECLAGNLNPVTTYLLANLLFESHSNMTRVSEVEKSILMLIKALSSKKLSCLN